jgi:hypothetical protein
MQVSPSGSRCADETILIGSGPEFAPEVSPDPLSSDGVFPYASLWRFPQLREFVAGPPQIQNSALGTPVTP